MWTNSPCHPQIKMKCSLMITLQWSMIVLAFPFSFLLTYCWYYQILTDFKTKYSLILLVTLS